MIRLAFISCLIMTITCYWETPHMLVALLAEQELKEKHPEVFSKVIETLSPLTKYFKERKESMVEASLASDHIKDDHFKFLEKSHFVDYPIYYKADPDLKFRDSEKLSSLKFMKDAVPILKRINSSLKVKEKLMKSIFLRWVIHIVGDMHQPLHSATLVSKVLFKGKISKSDWGGNLIKLSTFNQNVTNLHSLWDSAGIRYTVRPDLPLSPDGVKRLEKLADEVKNNFPTSLFGKSCQEKMPEVWANEAFKVAKDIVYKDVELTPQVTGDYVYLSRRETDRMISLGGCRLANLLVYIYSD